MPDHPPLTQKQRMFAEGVASGMTATAAAAAAGYANSSPASLRVQASRLAKDPDIQCAIFAHREKRLHGPLANKALSCLEGVMDDLSAPPAARIQAARFVLEAAGHGLEARRFLARHPDDQPTALSHYTIGELEGFIARQEGELRQAEGRVVEVERDSGKPDAQASLPG